MLDALTKLEDRLRRLGRKSLISRLQRALPRDVVSGELHKAGLTAPEELCALYGWHNGTQVGVGEVLDDFHLFPGFYFLSLEDALKDYGAFRNDRRWSPKWLPFLANGGGDFYAIECKKEGESPVIGFMIDEAEHPVEYSSISTMIASFIDAFDSGVFFVDARGYLQADDVRYIDVARRHNPDVPIWA